MKNKKKDENKSSNSEEIIPSGLHKLMRHVYLYEVYIAYKKNKNERENKSLFFSPLKALYMRK